MSNYIAAAIGTQKQFSNKPQDIYQKNLATPQVVPQQENKGMLLAQALGVFGDAIGNEGIAREKRREKKGIYEAEKIISGQTEEDLQKLNAIEMANNAGMFHVRDNPYAVSLIEKNRGKYISSRAKAEYSLEVIQKEGRAKTAQDEVARYNKFIQERYGQAAVNVIDEEAFQKGFYDNHMVDQTDIARENIKEQSADLEFSKNVTSQAKFGSLAYNALSVPLDVWKEAIQLEFNGERLTTFSKAKRIELAKMLAEGVARYSSDPERVKALADIVIGLNDDGTEMKLGDHMNLADAEFYAANRRAQTFDSLVSQELDRLSKMSVEQQNEAFEQMKKDNPTLFITMSNYRHALYNTAKQEEERQLKAQRAQVDEAVYSSQVQKMLRAQIDAFIQGHDRASNSAYVPTSFNDLPSITYTNANGQTVSRKPTKEEAAIIAESVMQEIKSDQSLTQIEKDRKIVKLLNSPVAELLTHSIQGAMATAFTSLTPDKYTPNNIPSYVKDALQMYQANQEDFRKAFKDVFEETEALYILGQGLGSQNDTVQLTTEGLNAFVLGKEKLKKNPELETQFMKDIQNNNPLYKLKSLAGLDGKEVDLPITDNQNHVLKKRIETTALYLMAAGRDVKTAVNEATKRAQQTYVGWRDAAIPKDIFNNLPTEYRNDIGLMVLEDYYKEQLDTGTDPINIKVDFDLDRNVLIINNFTYPEKTTRVTVDSITRKGLEKIEQISKGEHTTGQNITLEEAEQARKQTEKYTNIGASINTRGINTNREKRNGVTIVSEETKQKFNNSKQNMGKNSDKSWDKIKQKSSSVFYSSPKTYKGGLTINDRGK